MGRPAPIPATGPLRRFEYELKMPLVSIKGSCLARSPLEIDAWFAKRFAGCGRPTIKEIAHVQG